MQQIKLSRSTVIKKSMSSSDILLGGEGEGDWGEGFKKVVCCHLMKSGFLFAPQDDPGIVKSFSRCQQNQILFSVVQPELVVDG